MPPWVLSCWLILFDHSETFSPSYSMLVLLYILIACLSLSFPFGGRYGGGFGFQNHGMGKWERHWILIWWCKSVFFSKGKLITVSLLRLNCLLLTMHVQIRLLSMLEEYTILRQEKEEERRRQRVWICQFSFCLVKNDPIIFIQSFMNLWLYGIMGVFLDVCLFWSWVFSRCVFHTEDMLILILWWLIYYRIRRNCRDNW